MDVGREGERGRVMPEPDLHLLRVVAAPELFEVCGTEAQPASRREPDGPQRALGDVPVQRRDAHAEPLGGGGRPTSSCPVVAIAVSIARLRGDPRTGGPGLETLPEAAYSLLPFHAPSDW